MALSKVYLTTRSINISTTPLDEVEEEYKYKKGFVQPSFKSK
jgi:hypothetical protein